MYKLTTSVLLIFCLVVSLNWPKTAHAQSDAFDAYKENFLEAFWQINPEWATMVGYHKYDDLLTMPDINGLKKRSVFIAEHLKQLNAFDLQSLSPAEQIDFHLIRNELEKMLWQINEEQAWKWNPTYYNLSDLFATMLNESYAPLEDRLQNFVKRARLIPKFYELAKEQIQHPVPELQDLAAHQIQGGLSLFTTDFADSLSKTTLSDSRKAEMILVVNNAASAIEHFAAWLSVFKPENPRSFRLGAQLYENKFKYDIQSQYTAAELYEFAVQRKQFIHKEMARISRDLWPKYFGNAAIPTDTLVMIRKMIDTLSVVHVKPEAFQFAIEQQLPELVEFIKEKDLLYIDPSKPLVVRREPAYMAGVAGVSISAPGPYDKDGNTYYNVGSLEGWPEDKAESYLREYNHYILQILNIHEAIPGHYTQLVYANQSPSIIKSVFGNGAMIEGWAVYTEQMMLENGYGENAPEMWLMWYKWNLRTVCNTILDYAVHTQNMSETDAMKLLTEEAFQQQAEAEGKWKRVSVTQVQLVSYFDGYKEITALRDAIMKKEGDTFRLKKFHEQFLSYGSAPVKYIRQLMLLETSNR